MKGEADQKRLIEILTEPINLANKRKINLALETDLAPIQFLNLLNKLSESELTYLSKNTFYSKNNQCYNIILKLNADEEAMRVIININDKTNINFNIDSVEKNNNSHNLSNLMNKLAIS